MLRHIHAAGGHFAFKQACPGQGRAAMVFQITQAMDESRTLTQAVLQVTAMLGMLQAELARVLQVNCADIGQLSCGRRVIEPGTSCWEQAQLFVRFYQGLYRCMHGDGVAMRHWLRIGNDALGGVPHLMIVDECRLSELVDYVERDGCRWQAAGEAKRPSR